MAAKNMMHFESGKLKVIGYAGKDSRGLAKWLCRCECGNQVEIYGHNLRSGASTQCQGCQHREHSFRMTTHGQSRGDLYKKWTRWMSGGELCTEWWDAETFLRDISEIWSPQTPYILRKDKSKPFCRENVVASSCRYRTDDDRYSYSLSDIGRLIGRSRELMSKRLKKSNGKCVMCLQRNYVEGSLLCSECIQVPVA